MINHEYTDACEPLLILEIPKIGEPSAYVVQGRDELEQMAREIAQFKYLTWIMPELPDTFGSIESSPPKLVEILTSNTLAIEVSHGEDHQHYYTVAEAPSLIDAAEQALFCSDHFKYFKVLTLRDGYNMINSYERKIRNSFGHKSIDDLPPELGKMACTTLTSCCLALSDDDNPLLPDEMAALNTYMYSYYLRSSDRERAILHNYITSDTELAQLDLSDITFLGRVDVRYKSQTLANVPRETLSLKKRQ